MNNFIFKFFFLLLLLKNTQSLFAEFEETLGVSTFDKEIPDSSMDIPADSSSSLSSENEDELHEEVISTKSELPPQKFTPQGSLEVRAAAFFPSADRFRSIYGNVGADYQVEGCAKMYKHLDGWANFDWFSKHGKSVGLHDRTRVDIANVSLGLKFPFQQTNHFAVYVGIGPSLGWIWLKNITPCENQTISKVAIGGVLKTGVYYFINKHLFIDIFVDYLYQPVHFTTHVNIGGFKTGIGVGFKI